MSNLEYNAREAEPQSAAVPLDPSLVTDVQDLCTTWERAVKTICLYPASNPLPGEFQRKFHDTLQGILENRDDIALTVGDTWLSLGEARVYERQSTEDNLAYFLFRDGICRMEFVSGVEFDECCSFLNALAEVYATPGKGSDIANRLWQEALSHIRHYTLDRVVEGTYIGVAADEDIEARHRQFLETAEEETSRPDGAEPLYRGVQQDRYAYVMEVFGDVARLSTEEQSQLTALARSNSDAAAAENLGLEILFEILRTSERPRLIEETIAVIEKQFHRAVGADCWGMVKHILENWRASVPNTPASVSRQIKAAQMRAADARHFECLAAYLNANPDCDLREARGVLDNFGSLALTLITSMLGVLEHRAARLMVCDFLSENGRDAVDLIGGFVHDKRWFVVRNVAKVLGDIGNERAVSFLQRSAHHSDQRVRMETLRALQRLPVRTAQDILVGFLNDPQKEIRMRALRAVGLGRCAAATPKLAGTIDRESLTAFGADELRELFVAYARTAGTAARDRLVRFAKRSPLFGRQRWLPVRLAAVQAMAFCPAHDAQAELSALSRSRNRSVAQAAREALERRAREQTHNDSVLEGGKDNSHDAPDDCTSDSRV